MNPLQAAVRVVMVLDGISVGVPPLSVPLVRLGQSHDAVVGDVSALDQAYPLQLWESGQAHDRVVRQVHAAPQVDVTYPVAGLHESLDGVIGDVAAVSSDLDNSQRN